MVFFYLYNERIIIVERFNVLKFGGFFLFQRGSDELLSQSGAVSNGAAMSPQPHHAADNNNDAKKVSDDIRLQLIRFLQYTKIL